MVNNAPHPANEDGKDMESALRSFLNAMSRNMRDAVDKMDAGMDGFDFESPDADADADASDAMDNLEKDSYWC